jgi:thioester reductase-like protein
LNRPEETEDRFRFAFGERFYRTGDRCRWEVNGDLHFLGRRDSQIKIRGFRVELGEIEAKMAEHVCVRSAFVKAISERDGDSRLIAFYLREQNAKSTHERHVEEWRQIFDFIHTGDDSMFAGWHDSLEGKPMPHEDMATWREVTLSRIMDLLNRRPKSAAPARVLEIGCGTGLLLMDLASRCARYDATDISPTLVERLRKQCADENLRNSDILISEAIAPVFSGRHYDLVILNSVTQYFPDVRYLERAIDVAWERVAEGGELFLGDIRSLPLHDAFLHEVARFKVQGSAAIGEMQRLKAMENELVISPAGLARLAQGLYRFGGIHITPKYKGAPNEVTRFRFDASIRKGSPPRGIAVHWVAEAPTSLDDIEALARRSLAGKTPVGALSVPNSWTLVPPDERNEINPNSVIHTARSAGASCVLSWRSAHADGAFDVVFGTELDDPYALDFPIPNFDEIAWTNIPVSRQVLSAEEASIRTFLKGCLPSYMIPGLIAPISDVPLTAHGKVDRVMFPELRIAHSDRSLKESPRTAIEIRVASIWQGLLGLAERPFRGDNFFNLGGTSLTAIRLATQLRAEGFFLRPQVIFTHQTVVELSTALALSNEAEVKQHQPLTRVPSRVIDVKARGIDVCWPRFTAGTRVMLTGATGFLGIHLLKLLLAKNGVEIICPIRPNRSVSAQDRLASVYKWYFGEDLTSVEKDRITIFPADLANGPLTWVGNPVSSTLHMIIHTAADVRHVASREEIRRANITGVEAVLALAEDHSAAVHHISSIGVAGVWLGTSSPPTFSEEDLDVGQAHTEPYSESKFAAERLIQAFQNAGGKAVIYRASTIAPHANSGHFQQRFDAHFLIRQIKACLALGAAPERAGHSLSLVPVDIMADWILRIAEAETSNATYHLQAQKSLSYEAFYTMLNVAGCSLDILSDEAFKDRIFEAMPNAKLHDAIGVFLNMVNGDEARLVPIDSDRTLERLLELGADPADISQRYVDRFIADAVKRNCLTLPLSRMN